MIPNMLYVCTNAVPVFSKEHHDLFCFVVKSLNVNDDHLSQRHEKKVFCI